MFDNGDIIQGKFKVESILVKKDDGYHKLKCEALKMTVNGDESTRLKTIVIDGFFHYLFEEDEIEVAGTLKVTKKGRVLKTTAYEIVYPSSEKTILDFFSRRKSRVQRQHIKMLYKSYGQNLFSVIRENPEELNSFPITDKSKMKINDIVNSSFTFSRLINFLIMYDLSPSLANRIYEAYGENSMNVITDNPYRLYYSAEVPFSKLEILAKKFQKPYDFKERIKKGIIAYLDRRIEKSGDVFVEKGELVKKVVWYLKSFGIYSNPVSEELIEEQLEKIPNNIISKRVIDGKELIYKTYIKNVENRLVDLLLTKFILKKSSIDKEYVKTIVRKIGADLDKKQRQAVYTCTTNFISILTGKPGTGKTHTIKKTIESIRTVNPLADIKLLAPTGRASRRMEELTKYPAMTIHKAIGLRYSKQPTITIEADYIIVDESSMIDLIVFCNMLEMIEEGTKIIIVGDDEQLPSVGAGTILRDLIQCGLIPTTKLEKIFRQSGNENMIVQNSHLLLKRDFSNMKFNQGGFFFIEENNANRLKMKIIRSMEKIHEKYDIKLSDMMILTPMKQELLGTMDFNYTIQDYFNYENKENSIILGNQEFRLHDPVIQTENCYDDGHEVMNGEIGIITNINTFDEEITVEYDDGKEISYGRESAYEITLAYAITVHKSQGSEYPVVFMPIHNFHEYTLNKNLIYTAWTRARTIVVVVGQKEVLYKASQKDCDNRNSVLPYLLVERYNELIELKTA